MYHLLVWTTFALSGLVFLEPAPFDLLILILWAVGVLFSRLRYHRSLAEAAILLWLFALSNLLGMLWMEDWEGGLRFGLITLYLLFLWLFVCGLITRYPVTMPRILMSGYACAALLSTLIGLLTYFGFLPANELFATAGRIKGLFKDPNVFGPFLVPAALYTLLKITAARKWTWKLLWLLFFLSLSLGIFLSFSRAAWLNTAVSLLLLAILWIAQRQERLKHYLQLGALILLFLLAIQALFHYTDTEQMFAQRLGFQVYDTQRFANQIAAMEDALLHPWGRGPGQSEWLYDISTHSLYVRLLAENGLPGFLVFILFLLLTMARCLYLIRMRTPHTELWMLCLAALCGILVNSLVVDTLHWRHFWFLLALPWGYPYFADGR